MQQDAVYVNAYTKDDGTNVKEHFRSYPGGINLDTTSQIFKADYPAIGILQGGIENTIGLPQIKTSTSGVIDTISGVFDNIFKAASIASNVYSVAKSVASQMHKAKKNMNNYEVMQLQPGFNTTIEALRETQKITENNYKHQLEELVNAPNQEKYSKLYETFKTHRELKQKNNQTIHKIKRAAENNDYESVLNELENYQSDYQDVVAKTQKNYPLNNDIREKVFFTNAKNLSTTPLMNFEPKNIQSVQKTLVDTGMFVYNLDNAKSDAKELWKAASHDFNQSEDYIQKNGAVIYTVSELPSIELQSMVRNKLREQLNVNDSTGVILKSESSLSKAIANSNEIKEHFKKYKTELLQGKIIRQASTYFFSNQNLSKALGHADILYTHIGTKGNLYMLVFDTYDFNNGDSDWRVRMAGAVQNAGYLRNYYTLNIIVISKDIWRQWLEF